MLDSAGTTTYRLVTRRLVPAYLKLFARVTVEGLDNVPLSGAVILAANHRDNLDPATASLPRLVHVAARPDAFGTGGRCGIWRRLGARPERGKGLPVSIGVGVG
jgi:1-acyl-sn-glycerol-3-phosphate acyltransferase